VLAVLGPFARREAASRRRRGHRPPVPGPSWAAICQARLEVAGESRGRPRRPSETVPEYVAAIATPGADRVVLAGALIERSAFSGSELSPQEAGWVEEVLQELVDDAAVAGRLSARAGEAR